MHSKDKAGRLVRQDRRELAQTRASVLVVESDPLMLTAMGSVLDMHGFRAVLARSERIALDSIQAGEFDALVLSILELSAGCEFTSKLRESESSRDIPIIFLAPSLSSEWLQRLASHGGVYCMLQPADPLELVELVERSLWLPHLARDKVGPKRSHLSQADWVSLD